MTGRSSWPEVPYVGGPYGYSIMIVEEGGILLSCSGKLVPVKESEDIYKALTEEQKKLIWAQPIDINAAYTAMDQAVPGLMRRLFLFLSRTFAPCTRKK